MTCVDILFLTSEMPDGYLLLLGSRDYPLGGQQMALGTSCHGRQVAQSVTSKVDRRVSGQVNAGRVTWQQRADENKCQRTEVRTEGSQEVNSPIGKYKRPITQQSSRCQVHSSALEDV